MWSHCLFTWIGIRSKMNYWIWLLRYERRNKSASDRFTLSRTNASEGKDICSLVALVDSLLDSLDTAVDPDAEKLWQAKILRRARKIDEGSVQLVPWSELRSQLSLPI